MSRGRRNRIAVRPGESTEEAIERLIMSGHPAQTIAERLGEDIEYVKAIREETLGTPMGQQPNFERVQRAFNREN
jgi:hypothetical protein